MASLIYNKGKTEILNGGIDLLNDTIKVALVESSYTPNKDNHDFFNDITDEVSGTGYTAGGEVLSNKSVEQDNTNERAEFDADDTVWVTSTITARAAILYKFIDDENPSTNPLIAYIDFGADYSTINEDFTIEWDSEGILYLGE
jgi:hypothetical protein